jgi:hypothetical protein
VDQATWNLVGASVAAAAPDLFPNAVVVEAQKALQKRFKRIPRPEEFAPVVGKDRLEHFVRAVLEQRAVEIREAAEQAGVGSPCHLCGAARSDQDGHYDFALAKNVKRHWGTFAATLAANALTMPLGVRIMPYKIGRSATLARCRLVLCGTCASNHRGLLGKIKCSLAECAKHPSWKRLVAEGFAKFYGQGEARQFK